MTSTVGCTSCTAYGFEFTPTEAVTITGFAIRQAGIAQANRWGAFAIYNGSTGAIVTSCTTAFSLGTAQARLTCPATGSLAVGTIYELVWVANSTVATISAANSGVDLGARLINDTTHRVYTVPGQANLSAAPTVSWQSNLGTRTATNIEPPHVFLY
jgi:hypothetical protein